MTVCDEDEVAGGFRVQHRDRYTLYPKEKLVEEIIQGPVGAGFTLTLTETPQGARMDWSFRIEPKSLRFKIVGFFNDRGIVQGIADEYCKQLSD